MTERVIVARTAKEFEAALKQGGVIEAPAALIEAYGCTGDPGVLTAAEEAELVAETRAGAPERAD